MATTQTATRPLLDLHKGYRSTSALADRGLHKTNADLDEARHRPSQQDLEIARQLQSFHSQTNSSKHDEDARHDAEPRSAEMDTDDHELTTQQRAESPTASDRSERYLPSPNPTVTGQVCTWVLDETSIATGLTLDQQLWNDKDSTLETISYRCCHLQCVRTVLQSTKSDAACRAQAHCSGHVAKHERTNRTRIATAKHIACSYALRCELCVD